MLRINARYLECENSLYIYENQLFTGIGFELDDGIIKKKIVYKDGVILEEYNSELFDSEKHDDLWIDKRLIESEDEYEPIIFNGTLFSGIACRFNGHFCIGEEKYIDGEGTSECHYSFDGMLTYLDTNEKGFYQQYEWYKTGLYKKIIISQDENFEMELEFTKDQLLNQISIEGDYFKFIQSIKHDLIKDVPIINYDFFDHIQLSDKLFLASSGITDNVFEVIMKCKGYKTLTSITLFLTLLSTEYIMSFKELTSLSYIKIKDRREEIIDVVNKLKNDIPDCLIILNNEEIA